MERHPGFATAVIKLNIKWSHMSLERQSGRYLSSTVAVILHVGANVHNELATHGQVAIIWYILDAPSREAERITIVEPLSPVLGTIQVSVEIHLLPWIIFMDVFTVSLDLVDGVFDAI